MLGIVDRPDNELRLWHHLVTFVAGFLVVHVVVEINIPGDLHSSPGQDAYFVAQRKHWRCTTRMGRWWRNWPRSLMPWRWWRWCKTRLRKDAEGN